MKHRFQIVQTYRVERTIEIMIDAETVDLAQDMIDEGRVDVPTFDDPLWVESRSLEHEEACPA